MMIFKRTFPAVILGGTLALTLTACGATTGGLQNAIAQQAVATAVESQSKMAVTPVDIKSPQVNADSTCEQLVIKMAQLDSEISANQAVAEDGANGNVAEGLAMAGASQALAQSGALSRVPFGGMFANSALKARKKAERKKLEAAQTAVQNAAVERSKVAGLYAGKGCS